MFYKIKKPSISTIVIFLTIFFSLIQSVFCQERIDRAFDSIVNSDVTTKEKVTSLVTYSGTNRYVPATKKFILKAIEISNDAGDEKKLLLANSYYSLGNYYFYKSQVDSSLIALDLADENLNDENLILKASILATRGGVYSRTGDIIPAISSQLQAKGILENIDTIPLNTKEKIKRRGNISTISNSLANSYLKLDDFENALIYYDEAYELTTALKNKPNASIILSNKGELLIKMKRFEEALKTSKQAKQLKIEAKLPSRFIATSNFHVAIAYLNLDSLDLGLQYLNETLIQSKQVNYKRGEMMALAERGILYFENNKISKAKEDCTIALKIAEAINDSENKIKSCECLYKVENYFGNHKASLRQYKRYSELKDSIFNEKNIRNITKIGMQYEFDKKEAEQKLITEKREAEQKLVIEQKNRQRNRLLAGLGILSLLAILIVFFYNKRLKYQRTIAMQERSLKNQKIIELQQENRLTAMNSMINGQEKERARIAKDLHDGLGSLLSSVKSHFLATQEEEEVENKKTVKKTEELIDQAVTEVRRISHNMMPHALVISGLEDGIKDIVERLEIANYQVTLEIKELPKLNETQEVMIYRLIQEIVSNIKKHAKATSVFIQLYSHKQQVYLMIEDNGIGFDLEEMKLKKGLGLQNIESRVAYLNGVIHWDTGKGKGTSININFKA